MKVGLKSNTNVEAMMKRLGEDVVAGLVAGTTSVIETADALITPLVPVKTSNLVNSATSEVSDDGTRGTLRWTAEYGKYVNDGTFLYGPYKVKPKGYPKRAKGGMKGAHFVETGVKNLNAQKAFEDGMGNYLKKKGW